MSFDIWEMFLPKADKYGQKVGKVLPDFVKGLYARVKDKLGFDWDGSLPPDVQKWIPEIVEALAGGAKLERGSVPFKGKLGDEICEYANEFINAMGVGASERLEAGGDKSKPDGKSGKDDGKKAYDRLDPDQPVYVIDGSPYPVGCSHRQPFSRKGEGKPTSIPLREAIRRRHMPHDPCFGNTAEIDQLIVAALTPPKPAEASDAKADPKPAPKDDEPKIPEPKNVLAPAEHTLFDLFGDLREENQADHAAKYDQFVLMVAQDPELLRKFFDAFHGRGTYAQFKRLVIDVSHTNWHLALDSLLGRPKLPESTFQRERRETKEAIEAFTKWIQAGAPKRKAKLDARKLRLEELRAQRAGDKKKLKEIRAQIAELES